MAAKPNVPNTVDTHPFAHHLRKIAHAKGRERKIRGVDELAKAIVAADAALPFLNRLADTDRNGQRLALEIAMRLPLPLSESLCRLLVPMLGSSHFAVPLRLNVGIQCLRSLTPANPATSEVLRALIRGLSPSRAVERLRFVQQRLPDNAAVDRLCGELEKKAAIPCPRCGIRLQRPELVMHLWQQHRLLMEGNRVLEPWRLIANWLREYAETGKRTLLERGSELAQQLDPQGGLTRVHRLLLSSGMSNEEAQGNLTEQAQSRRASLCPHCYALVQHEEEPLPPPLNISRGRITSQGYEIEVSDQKLFTHLYVATPDEVIHSGKEPGRGLTIRGAILLLIGPLVFASLLVALLMPPKVIAPLTPVALLLLAALALYIRLRSRRSASDPTGRAIDNAWEHLVPELDPAKQESEEAAFIARLAVTSIGLGSPKIREPWLDRASKSALEHVTRGGQSTEDLTALRCLEMDDAVRLERDPLPILAREVGQALTGALPIQYVENLLEAWPDSARDRGQRARLRILSCARAFEAGLEPHDLQELGRLSPALREICVSDDLAGLTRLRWVWEARSKRPWQKLGAATTVFDLARYPALGGQYLEERPDLLLFQPMSAGSGKESGAPILICEKGVVYRHIVIADPETTIAARPARKGSGYDLIIGKKRIHFGKKPALLESRLEGWVRFLFRELLPGANKRVDNSSPARLRKFRKQKTIQCPECGHAFLALRGDVGLLTDAEAGRGS
jgi:DNA-directed RNA polymerase subunit RPC12/RpoP